MKTSSEINQKQEDTCFIIPSTTRTGNSAETEDRWPAPGRKGESMPFICMCVCVCARTHVRMHVCMSLLYENECQMCLGAQGAQKRVSEPTRAEVAGSFKLSSGPL